MKHEKKKELLFKFIFRGSAGYYYHLWFKSIMQNCLMKINHLKF